jgi:hypothetical protein
LEADFRLVGGNSGIQYRSHEVAKWVIGGYQADFDAAGKYTGILYEEKGRGILALRGKKVVIDADGKRQVVGTTCDEKEVMSSIKNGGWNHYRIWADGPWLRTWVNGVACADLIDTANAKGFIALQVHAGKQGQIRWRNLRLQQLPPTPWQPTRRNPPRKSKKGVSWRQDTREQPTKPA